MSNKDSVFRTIQQPQHFTDYGFEPQIDYFQVMEEARKQRRESTARSVDLRCRLQKPVSRDDASKKIKKAGKKRWWRNALLFFKLPRWAPPAAADLGGGRRRHRVGSISGPVYVTESGSGSDAGYCGSRKGGVEIPYISLRELDVDRSPTPIYLVT